MRRRHAPLGFAVVLLSLLGAVAVRGDSPPRWTRLQAGVEFATMRGDPWCRHGSSEIALLRVDPARVRLRVLHYTRQQERKPLSIVEWQRRTQAIGVFNAASTTPTSPTWVSWYCDGEGISTRIHPVFKRRWSRIARTTATPRGCWISSAILSIPVPPDGGRWRSPSCCSAATASRA
jgi:hypothetical protein